jgi:hypothetical protein
MQAFRKKEKELCLETAAAGAGEKTLRFVSRKEAGILVYRRSRHDPLRHWIPGIVFNDAKRAPGFNTRSAPAVSVARRSTGT